MRKIGPGDACLTAEEIVVRFRQLTGHAFHASNAGNAAKALGLDYVEFQVQSMPFRRRKLYSEIDLPKIFDRLHDLAERREKLK